MKAVRNEGLGALPPLRPLPKHTIELYTYTIAKSKAMNFIKQIQIEHGLRKQIMEALEVTYPTIKAALTFKSNTLTAKTIRQYALDHGGILLLGSQDDDKKAVGR